MSYRIPLPSGGRRERLDLVDPTASAVQRLIRQRGLSSFEPPTVAALLSLFESQGTDLVFFDVGANIGLYAAMCSSLFDPVAVHAFEPAPTTASMARAVMHANGLDVDVVECALADQDGTALLHFSPISDASNSMVSGFRESVDSIQVATLRMDSHVESTGVIPTVVKIDVETFEPSVLAGATRTIALHRPTIVIEVLYRAERDLGAPITEALAGLGYSFYHLSPDPDWVPRSAVKGIAGEHCSDWLLTPEPLATDFAERWQVWSDRLSQCGPERNARPPVSRSVVAAWRRGGVREIVATARRHVVSPGLSNALTAATQVARRLRRTAMGRAAGSMLRRGQYRSSRPPTHADRVIDRCISLDPVDAAARERSAAELVELFFELVEAVQVDLFVEAGAKDGAASTRAATRAGTRVVAFEANPFTHARFAAGHAAGPVTYEPLALTDDGGSATFLVRRDGSGHAMADGQGSLLERPDHTTGYIDVTVEATSLDRYFGQDAAEHVAMWIDVEGAVAQVVRGATEVLGRTDVLIVEVESTKRWDGQEWLADDVIANLAYFGLRPIARDQQSRRQYNVLFVRDSMREVPDVAAAIDAWRAGR